MKPTTYLTLLGIVLLVVGILGFIHVIGPTPADSPFGNNWYFDTVENIGHTIVGLFALLVAFTTSGRFQRQMSLVGGIAGTLAGLYSLLIATYILGANFQNPADTIFHLAIGAAGFWAYFSSQKIKL